MENKEKNVIARVGNFVVSKESGNGLDWVSVKAVSGFWTVRYREDNAMYGRLMMLAKDEVLHPYLEAVVHSLYVMSCSLPDLEFLGDFTKAFNAMQERVKAQGVAHTEEGDKDALEEARVMEEMKEELKNERE